jgi:hypothetical protein
MLAWIGGGVLVAVLLYAGLRWFAKARAADNALALRTFAAVFSALASTGLVFSHRFGFAVITVAATAMAVRSLVLAGRATGGGASGPRSSEAIVETALLAMRLDRQTSHIDGTVRRGQHEGQLLSRLGLPVLLELLETARRDDPPSVDLLEAYLDRREPDWRRSAAGARAPPTAGAAMDEATALGILGLPAGASADEVKAAHRRLMAKLHPDHGGSTFLASQINQAKDFLLGRARVGGS